MNWKSQTPVKSNPEIFSQIAQVMREKQSFAVLSHVRPDGDALGSQLFAMALTLTKLGKDVRVWNEDGMLEKYAFLPRAELLTRPPATKEKVDVLIALDTAIQNRMGTALDAVAPEICINIDHHPSNPRYGELVYVDPTSPATGQILFELLKAGNFPIDADIAENLFVAISTDTGSFQYSNTTTRTFEIVA